MKLVYSGFWFIKSQGGEITFGELFVVEIAKEKSLLALLAQNFFVCLKFK